MLQGTRRERERERERERDPERKRARCEPDFSRVTWPDQEERERERERDLGQDRIEKPWMASRVSRASVKASLKVC